MSSSQTPQTRRSAKRPRSAAPTVDQPAAAPEHEHVDAWAGYGKALCKLQIETALAMLRQGQTLREAQLATNQKARAQHEQAAQELEAIPSLADAFSVQISLLQSNLQGALDHWNRIGEACSTGQADAFARIADAWLKLPTSLLDSAQQWSQLRSKEGPAAMEEIEASVDHLVNPALASPMLWPAQEAAREAMSLATTALNDWLTWSTHRHPGPQSSAVH